MSKALSFEPEAERELEDAALWYEEQGPGLGSRFFDAVSAALERLRRFPKLGATVPFVSKRISARRVPVERFPYHVVYIDRPTEIRILAVAHDRRRPGYWLGRTLPSD